ncbi:hypothetical protein RFI_24060 [Reticulomyxa filosa]|uniref:Ubiquitin-like domain-containing protein n=1 Tax=Reticulomyxa filosa TaxID=46433 RepID=X6MH21_RETFI|nr:hypothetical protein RFI_24060 [Reticulomyxa filosa]|eukprot:ETO13313.1 hypothetical protein RFI_24060 [Reticulomyxa filosa]
MLVTQLNKTNKQTKIANKNHNNNNNNQNNNKYREDKAAREKHEQWQKEARMITLNVHYSNGKKEKSNELSLENGNERALKVDPMEMTFRELKAMVRDAFEISDDQVAWERCRLRKYYPAIDFMAEGYDDENIQDCPLEIAKFNRIDTHLILEVLRETQLSFDYFNPNDILISLFVVTDKNMAAVVERGFVQPSLLMQQDMPEGLSLLYTYHTHVRIHVYKHIDNEKNQKKKGDFTTIIVDSTKPLNEIKQIIFGKLKSEGILPQEWTDPSKLNLIRFGYQKCTVFVPTNTCRSLENFNVKLGDLLYVEHQPDSTTEKEEKDHAQLMGDMSEDKENDNMIDVVNTDADIESDAKVIADDSIPTSLISEEQKMKEESDQLRREQEQLHKISKLARYYEEQRLKITILFNRPLPVKPPIQRIEDLVKTEAGQSSISTVEERISFDHVIRISKESPLGQLKEEIGKQLGLDIHEFRLRKARNDQEFKNLKKTISHYNITEGGVVYVERGVPTKPNEIRVSFALYDPLKKWTDPWKQIKTLYRDLFEYPFDKNILVKDMKSKIVQLLDQFFR